MTGNQPSIFDVIRRLPEIVSHLLAPFWNGSEFNWAELKFILTSDDALEIYFWGLLLFWAISFISLMFIIVTSSNKKKKNENAEDTHAKKKIEESETKKTN
jgi:hypothetical protein